MSLYIHGIGHFHPEHVIDNAFLEALDIGTNDEWIMQRVGIKTRRTVLPLEYIQSTHNQDLRQSKSFASYTSAKTGALAAQKALSHAKIQPKDIGMVIAGGCDPDYLLPANASVIAAELGIEAEAFDINSACSTFATQIHTLMRMKPETLPDYILLVMPENWTTTIDYQDRNTAVLIGDCSVAVIVSAHKPSAYHITYSTLSSNPAGWSKVMTPTNKHFYQEGRAVQKFAIKKTMETTQHIQDQAKLTANQHYFIGHQANLLMLQSVCRKLDIPEHRHLFNVDRYGNCGAAGGPSVLSESWETFKSGDKIIMVVVGSGLTWGGLLIEVGDEH